MRLKTEGNTHGSSATRRTMATADDLPATVRTNQSGRIDASKRSGIDWYIWLVALSALAFCNFSPTEAATVFIAAVVLCVLLRPATALRSVFYGALPVYYLLLASISILWSQAPESTTRYVIEFAITTGAAMFMARALRPGAFLAILLLALLFTEISSMIIGRSAWNAGALATIGVFGSKNAFSEAQAILFLVSCRVLLSNGQSIVMRLLALFAVFTCPPLLLAGRSADSVFAVVVACSVSFLGDLRWSSRRWRVPIVLFAGGIAACSLLIAYPYLDELQSRMLTLTGKDVTLSGRTYLWFRAGQLISQTPLFGTGFGAFWIPGNPYAEELWMHFGITGRTGFNFHNLWYEVAVELGYPGVFVAALTVTLVSIEVIRWVIRSPSAESCFFLAYVLFIDMRTVLEVDLFSQFSLTWVLFITAWAYARENRRSNRSWKPISSRDSIIRKAVQNRKISQGAALLFQEASWESRGLRWRKPTTILRVLHRAWLVKGPLMKIATSMMRYINGGFFFRMFSQTLPWNV
jgi:exopolysaccharide production protein ExoQ